jgi:hypothetical protein
MPGAGQDGEADAVQLGQTVSHMHLLNTTIHRTYRFISHSDPLKLEEP